MSLLVAALVIEAANRRLFSSRGSAYCSLSGAGEEIDPARCSSASIHEGGKGSRGPRGWMRLAMTLTALLIRAPKLSNRLLLLIGAPDPDEIG